MKKMEKQKYYIRIAEANGDLIGDKTAYKKWQQLLQVILKNPIFLMKDVPEIPQISWNMYIYRLLYFNPNIGGRRF